MSKIDTFKKLWMYDKRQVLVAVYNNIVHTGITNVLPDEAYLKLTYRVNFGEKLDLNNPVTFNQKLQWLKLYDRQERYIELVDKILVKDYVAKVVGAQYVIPTLGVWDNFDDINFNDLPDQFVLKCNHDSGSVVICRDKAQFDVESARKKLSKALKTDMFYWGREWPYKDIKRKIFAEAYMEDSATGELRDYKFFTFGGVVRLIEVVSNRQNPEEETNFDFFDAGFKHLDLYSAHHGAHPNANIEPEKPHNFEQMKILAEKLGTGIPHLRVDFYEVDGKVYFGELTFFHAGGFGNFKPEQWRVIMGNWIQLPEKK